MLLYNFVKPLVCHNYFHQALIGFPILWLLLYYLLISCFTTCILFHQSPALILSYHECSLLDIICCISTCSCMLVLTIRFSMHVYDLDLSIHMCLSILATWHSHHHSPGSSVWLPGSSCSDFGAWSLWILPVADQSGAAEAWIPSRPSRALSFQASLLGYRVFLLWLWASICTVHTCPSFVFSHLRHIGDVILL